MLEHSHALTAAHTTEFGFQNPGLDPSPDVQVSTSITVHTERANALLPPQPFQYPQVPLCPPVSTSSGASFHPSSGLP